MRYQTLFALIFLLSITLATAAEFPFPQGDYVNDFAGILTAEQFSTLTSLLANIRNATTAEVVFVSVESCAPYAPGDYATRLGQEWGVGKSDLDNGVVELYCVEEKKFWVATGYGVEGILPDSKIGRFLDQTYVPQRDAGNVAQGVIDFTAKLSEEMIFYKEEIISGESSGGNDFKIPPAFIFLFFIFLAGEISNFSKNYKKAISKKVYSAKASVKFLPYIISVVLIAVGVAMTIVFFLFIILYFITSRIGVGRSGVFIWAPVPRGGGGFGGGGFGGGFGGGGFGGGGMGR